MNYLISKAKLASSKSILKIKQKVSNHVSVFIEDETGSSVMTSVLVAAIIILGVISIQSAIKTWFGTTNTTILEWITTQIGKVLS